MTEVKSGLSLPGLPWRPDWAKESEAQRVLPWLQHELGQGPNAGRVASWCPATPLLSDSLQCSDP